MRRNGVQGGHRAVDDEHFLLFPHFDHRINDPDGAQERVLQPRAGERQKHWA